MTKKIIWIALIVAGAGLLLALVTFFAGAQTGVRITGNGVELQNNAPMNTGFSPDQRVVMTTRTGLEAFQALDIRVKGAQVEVVAGDSYSLELWSYELEEGKSSLQYELKGDTLSIWDKHRDQRNGWALNLGFNFSYSEYWDQPEPVRIILTLPQGAEMREVAVKADFSDMWLRDLQADTVDLKGSYGSLDLGNTRAQRIKLELDGGEIRLDNLIAGELSVKNSFGQVTLNNGGELLETVIVRGDSCDVSLGVLRAGSLEVKNNFGQVRLDAVEIGQQLTINADSCDIELDGVSAVTADIKDSFGTVRLDGVELARLGFQGDSCDLSMNSVSVDAAEIKDNFGEITATNWRSGELRVKGDSCTLRFEGALRGVTDIDNNFGNVTLQTDLDREDYLLDAEVDFGTIQVDGATMGGVLKDSPESRAAHSIRVDNDSGNLTVSFGG